MDTPRATFVSRRLLAEAHRLHGRWAQVHGLLAECLDEYDRRSWRFERDDEVELAAGRPAP
ncbi:hypothetical protein [Amycolatopsis aidingensis]|uniref:hypothetical protein n=1 Tax=Amycolatopsis aidingensis TaxID=2842453 RepID=UPI001C0B51E5|nr:hypothetical protein [Amycolatopsis aidingensis]